MNENVQKSYENFIENNKGTGDIHENSKIIRTINRMDDPAKFFEMVNGEGMVIGGRKGKTVLVPTGGGGFHRINPKRILKASLDGEKFDFAKFRSNLQTIYEEDLTKVEIGGKKVFNFDKMTQYEKSRMQWVIEKTALYNKEILDIALLIAKKLKLESAENYLSIVEIVSAYYRGKFLMN
uniref:Uncharacterized protein n=1 Tax=Panagrolaimus sp. JU765 TaxID=591449 RepID=A0AC34QMI7_9BILA